MFRRLYIPVGLRVNYHQRAFPTFYTSYLVMAKRKRSEQATATVESNSLPPPAVLRGSGRKASGRQVAKDVVNPDINGAVIDGDMALRDSPDGEMNENLPPNGVEDQVEPLVPLKKKRASKATAIKNEEDDEVPAPKPKRKQIATKLEGDEGRGEEGRGDPEGDEEIDADPDELQAALGRPPPMNSDKLPLPWKGRIGYACLCTYLRYSNPPVFSSRTTRIASILEHRHPLKDPSQPEHPIKNRPDKEKPADVRRGQEFVEQLCLANVKDISKMLRWNDKYGIKFLRLSSEAFPFASHAEYGYKLAPFASDALAEAGKVVAELGHRVTTHPGQFTQLGSPRESVIENALRDLQYHDEMLSLLKLPPQQDRDAVMILHLGGVFGDKEATLNRFRKNYAGLSDSIKNRLVLENDDVSYGVHELLPLCEELNIPLVLDFHHHNIIFDADQIREGTKDIIDLFPRILATWERKRITPKMHYSEPTPAAITGRQRRKHNPRVATLPPCPNNMDLMIEAKDKEQAVFELMRVFKLPGFEKINDIIPNQRNDDNKSIAANAALKKKAPKKRGKGVKQEDDDDEEGDSFIADAGPQLAEEDVGMGGPDNRVYWPPGMEEWLRPVKRVVKKKDAADGKKEFSMAEKMKIYNEIEAIKIKGRLARGDTSTEGVPTLEHNATTGEPDTPATQKAKALMLKREAVKAAKINKEMPAVENDEVVGYIDAPIAAKKTKTRKVKREPTASTSLSEQDSDEQVETTKVQSGRKSARANKAPRKSYKVSDAESE